MSINAEVSGVIIYLQKTEEDKPVSTGLAVKGCFKKCKERGYQSIYNL